MANNLRRIKKEIDYIKKQEMPGIAVHFDQNNISLWHAVITGEKGTPYEGGKFHLKIQLPQTYPFKPPQVTFLTKIYHPGIRPSGQVCCCYNNDITGMKKVLLIYQAILSEQSIAKRDVCGDTGLLKLYINDKQGFLKTVRQWTIKYATPEKEQSSECSI